VESGHLDIIPCRHHDDFVRTTVTLDRDVAEGLEREMHRSGRGLKATINDALRRGLRLGAQPPKARRFVVQPQALGVKPGIDLDRMNQLADELEAEHAAARLRRS
jgi:hypothetical protein